ncbi:MAG TPA: hypothetical protein VFZ17_14150 [Acidimicrobiia bacterium]|nr:hypothetical protein [Acidimicrobiia bacterium]
MTDTIARPEPYDSYHVGDAVWCLAWVGMPFVITGKNDEKQTIEIDGVGPCSLPEGALIDVTEANLFMLTHEQWDSIWYWPDSDGERYQQVVDRFVEQHREGELVNGYVGSGITVTDSPDGAMAFRLSFAGYGHFGQILATPVAAIADDGSALLHLHDPAIPDARWLQCGPALPLEIKMTAYRWSLAYGKLVLNWQDFD